MRVICTRRIYDADTAKLVGGEDHDGSEARSGTTAGGRRELMAWHNTRPRTRHQRAPAAFIDPCLPTKVNKPPAGRGRDVCRVSSVAATGNDDRGDGRVIASGTVLVSCLMVACSFAVW